jgi:ABC-2 type transport system permease protein
VNGLALCLRYVVASLRSQAQYPASTALMTLGQLFSAAIEVVGVWALFDRFGHLQGWRFGEVLAFYALVNLQFRIADLLSRGFDVLGTAFLRTGDFDRLLLRPRSLTLQLIGHEVRLSRFGRLVTAAVLLVVATHTAPIDWTAARAAVAVWALAGGIALFFGILVLQGTLAFWTVESLEIANVLTYGGAEAAQYPLAIYQRWFRNVLTFGVPLACVAYFPVLVVLGRADPLGTPAWLGVVSPLAGFVFLRLAFVAWGFGVRRYASSGS